MTRLPVTVGNAQTISFDNYTVATPIDLHNDMGQPYEVAESYYHIQAIAAAAPAAPMPPTGLSVSGPREARRRPGRHGCCGKSTSWTRAWPSRPPGARPWPKWRGVSPRTASS